MRGLHVSVIALVWAAAPPLQLPIPTPDKAPWEMTFVEVEELAGLPPLAMAPRDTQVADAAAIWLRMWSDRRYREDYCNNLTPGTPAGDLYEWMAREAAAVAARW